MGCFKAALLAVLCLPLFWFAVLNPRLWVALAILAGALFAADRLGLLVYSRPLRRDDR